jgi:hypothetical protein
VGACYAWAVWSAWRGNLPLLAHTARVMCAAVAEAEGSDAKVEIEFAVRGDVERFESVEDMTERVTPQAVARFAGIRIGASAGSTAVELRLVRRTTPAVALVHEPGLVLHVGGRSTAAAESVRDRVQLTVSRGGFGWAIRRWLVLPVVGPSREPVCGSDADGWKVALGRRVSVREIYYLVSVSLLMAALLMGVTYAPADPEDLTGVLLVLTLVLAPTQAALILLQTAKPGTALGRLKSRVWSLGFPAVELADVTPGRRASRLLVRLAAGAVVAAIGLGVDALLGG